LSSGASNPEPLGRKRGSRPIRQAQKKPKARTFSRWAVHSGGPHPGIAARSGRDGLALHAGGTRALVGRRLLLTVPKGGWTQNLLAFALRGGLHDSHGNAGMGRLRPAHGQNEVGGKGRRGFPFTPYGLMASEPRHASRDLRQTHRAGWGSRALSDTLTVEGEIRAAAPAAGSAYWLYRNPPG